MAESLDPTDWAILVEVQRDGRIPLTELGRRVNLSASATTERVKRLESSGIISGVAAIYNRHSYLDEMRGAVAKWEHKLRKLIAPLRRVA